MDFYEIIDNLMRLEEEEKDVVIERQGEFYIETKYGLIEFILPKAGSNEGVFGGYNAVYYDFEDVIRIVDGYNILQKIDCEFYEQLYDLSTYAKKKLYNLKVNSPQEYFNIVGTEEFDEYIETFNKSSSEMGTSLYNWFKERNPSMSDTEIWLSVNELILYDN